MDQSVDLITVAQALHWFDFKRFYTEVDRVLKKEGVLAAWAYGLLCSEHTLLNHLIHQFYSEITAAYWPKERRYIDEKYQTIPFPLNEITMPKMSIQLHWTLTQLLNYFNTWSAVKNYEKKHQKNIVDDWLKPKIIKSFPCMEDNFLFEMPLIFKVGRL